MDVWAITLAVLRRWYVFLPLLILSVAGALWVGNSAPERYQSASTVVLVPGSETTEIVNPYGGIGETANVLEVILGSTATRNALEEQGLSPEYVVDMRSQSRIIDFVVTGDSEEASLGTIDHLIDMMVQELVVRQDAAGIPAGAQVSVEILEEPTVVAVVSDGKLRNMAVVGVLGGALSLLVAVVFDDLVGLGRRWLQSRQRLPEKTSRDNRAAGVNDAVAHRG